jgi:hypothetical protein
LGELDPAATANPADAAKFLALAKELTLVFLNTNEGISQIRVDKKASNCKYLQSNNIQPVLKA